MDKYRVLLATPPYHPYNLADEKVYVVEPIQFEVLASLLEEDHFEVKLLDLRLDRDPRAFVSELKGFKPHMVGFTSWTMHVASVRRHMAIVKALDPSITTVVGGHHAGIEPADFADGNIDYVMMGEAYLSFKEFMERCRTGEKSVDDLPGIAWRRDDVFFSNGSSIVTKRLELDSLPFPKRSVLGKYSGQYYHLWWKPVASLRTGMGCPSRCSFCNLWRPNLGKYLTWSPEYVIEYLKTLAEPYVLFVDDHFFGDPRRAQRLGELILRAGIKKQYCLYSRSDAIVKHPELLELWGRVGLKRVRMGLESYSNDELDGLTKCNSVETNDEAIRLLKKNKVLTEGLFMIGLHYTKREFEQLAQYIRSRKIEVPNITVYTPMPGTSDFDRHKDEMVRAASEYFDFQHAVLNTRLPLPEFSRRYGKLLLKVQRPPLEQIRLIGLSAFVKRMPSFWGYFLSVYNSHHHYSRTPSVGAGQPKLPWLSLNSGPRPQSGVHTIEPIVRSATRLT